VANCGRREYCFPPISSVGASECCGYFAIAYLLHSFSGTVIIIHHSPADPICLPSFAITLTNQHFICTMFISCNFECYLIHVFLPIAVSMLSSSLIALSFCSWTSPILRTVIRRRHRAQVPKWTSIPIRTKVRHLPPSFLRRAGRLNLDEEGGGGKGEGKGGKQKHNGPPLV
jgi:hypothetical protein